MKRGMMLLVCILLFPCVLGIEIDLSKDVYYPGETLQAEISGNFVSLKLEDIEIYKLGTPRPMPVISNLVRRNGIYYFYAVLPNSEGNFTIEMKNINYYENKMMEADISRNFLVERYESNDSILSIEPGFVLTDSDFFVNVKSLKGARDIKAELIGTNETRLLTLIPFSEKKLKFSVSEINEDTILKIEDYSVNIFLNKKGSFVEDKDIIFYPAKIKGSAVADKNYYFEVIMEYIGNENVLVQFEKSENIDVSPISVGVIPNERILLNISVSIPKKIEGNFSEAILAVYEDKEERLPVVFEIIEDESDINLNGTSVKGGLGCLSQGGEVCLENEKCVGDITPSLEGSCCIGECVEIKESYWQYIIGGVLIVVLVLIIGFLVWRAKKKGGMESPKDMLKKRTEKSEEKMSGKSQEVKGSLGKV